MSLLPRSHTEFQSKAYWEKFFQKRASSFEWYGEYLDLCHVLHRYIKPQNKVLVIGCGNSKLSEDLYDVGCTSLENIDISDTVIKQMNAKNHVKRPQMKFTVMDATALAHENESFDCILDKGTLDALFTDRSDKTVVSKVRKMFGEVIRVLKTGGRYVCVSLSQEHILKEVLDYFNEGWVIRVHKVDQKEEERGGVGSHLPVFIFVLTKMMSIPGRASVKVYEYFTDDDQSIRCDNVDGIVNFVKDCQQYALVRHSLASTNLEEQVKMELWSSSSASEPRYTLRVVDQPKKKIKNGPFAIFIVPQGRETNWLFSTEDGCKELAENAGFERLVIVTLHRGHSYDGIEQVKQEVSPKAVELKQSGLPDDGKWPVLTVGESVGARTVLCEDSSLISGDFIVEDVEGDNGVWIRNLIFLSSPHLTQTEVLLKPGSIRAGRSKSSKESAPHYLSKPTNLVLDHTHLLFSYHQCMMASLCLINGVSWSRPQSGRGSTNGPAVRLLTIGLGGGAFPMHLKACLSHQISQDVVELDRKVLEVATKWFGFSYNDDISGANCSAVAADQVGSLNVHIQNGIEFVCTAASTGQRKYDAVVLDVDCKDTTSGLSSPPIKFTTTDFLTSVRSILNSGGIFVSNLCARNKAIETQALDSISRVFKTVLVINIADSVNKVLIAMPELRHDVIGTATNNKTPPCSTTDHRATGSSKAGIQGQTINSSVKLQLLKPLRQKIKQFSSAVDSNRDIKDMIFTFFDDCMVFAHE